MVVAQKKRVLPLTICVEVVNFKVGRYWLQHASLDELKFVARFNLFRIGYSLCISSTTRFGSQ